jgi:hypothetical protein
LNALAHFMTIVPLFDEKPSPMSGGLAPIRQPIGFVLPKSACARRRPSGAGGRALRGSADKSTQPGDRRDGGPRIARPARFGFVLPKSAQPGGGRDGDPRVAPPPRGGRRIHGIEGPDRRVSPRQRAALIAVEPHQPQRDVVLAETFRHDLQAHAADAQDVDLRLGDAERGGALRFARLLAGDPPRQGRGLGRERGIGQHRHAQPMAQRVARHHGLAGRRARAGAACRIGAVGGAESFIRAWSGRRSGFHRARRRPRGGGIRCRHIVSLGHAASGIYGRASPGTPAVGNAVVLD